MRIEKRIEKAAPFDNTSSQRETDRNLLFTQTFPSEVKLKLQLVVYVMIHRVSQKKLRKELCWSHGAQALKRSQVISMGKFGFTALNFG